MSQVWDQVVNFGVAYVLGGVLGLASTTLFRRIPQGFRRRRARRLCEEVRAFHVKCKGLCEAGRAAEARTMMRKSALELRSELHAPARDFWDFRCRGTAGHHDASTALDMICEDGVLGDDRVRSAIADSTVAVGSMSAADLMRLGPEGSRLSQFLRSVACVSESYQNVLFAHDEFPHCFDSSIPDD